VSTTLATPRSSSSIRVPMSSTCAMLYCNLHSRPANLISLALAFRRAAKKEKQGTEKQKQEELCTECRWTADEQ
jgi:hypothetical protein